MSCATSVRFLRHPSARFQLASALLLFLCTLAAAGCEDNSPAGPSGLNNPQSPFGIGRHTVTVAVSPSDAGTVSSAPAQSQYLHGTTVTLTATAASGYRFAGWKGDAAGATNPVTLKVDSNKTVTAAFASIAPDQFALSVSASPTDGGTIARAPDQPQYVAGTVVTLTATPGSGYQFAGWQGDASGSTNPIAVKMDGNKTVTAAFTPSQFAVAVSVSPSNAGTIARAPDEPQHAAGTIVTLTATPASGYQFTGWQGDATGTSNPIAVTVDGDKAITGVFTRLGTTTFINRTEDSMAFVSLAIDGVEQLHASEVVLPGERRDVVVSPGTHSYTAAFGDLHGGVRHDFYTRSGSYTRTPGDQTVEVSGRTLVSLLAPDYWTAVCQMEGTPAWRETYRFLPDGRYDFYRDGTKVFSGSYGYPNHYNYFVHAVSLSLGSEDPLDWAWFSVLSDDWVSYCWGDDTRVTFKRSTGPSAQPSSGSLRLPAEQPYARTERRREERRGQRPRIGADRNLTTGVHAAEIGAKPGGRGSDNRILPGHERASSRASTPR